MANLNGTIVAGRVVLAGDGFTGSVHQQNADGTLVVGGRGKDGFERRTVTPAEIKYCGDDIKHRSEAYCRQHSITFITMKRVVAYGDAHRNG